MKLSAILALSVPIVAMSQAPALADNTAASTGDWLKQSLATLKPAKHSAAHKVAHAAPSSGSASGTIRLRPFVPNRYLPRESDLRNAMVAQQAKYDDSVDIAAPSGQSLSGQVSSYRTASRPSSAYDQYALPAQSSMSLENIAATVAKKIATAKKTIGTRSPRVMPGQSPILPEQLAQQQMVAPTIPEPPIQRAMKALKMPMAMQMPMQMNQMQMNQMPMQMSQMQGFMPQQMMAQLPPMPQRNFQRPPVNNVQQQFQSEALTDQQQMELERFVETNPPSGRMDMNGDVTGVATDNPGYGAGQSPLSTNFPPMNPMQSMHVAHHRAPTAQARFGSWHERPQMSGSGFQSYCSYRKPRLLEFQHSQAMAAKPKAKATKSKKQMLSSRPLIAQAAPKFKSPFVASYGVYTSPNGRSY